MNARNALILIGLTILFGGTVANAQIPDVLTGASPYPENGMLQGGMPHGDSEHAGMVQQWSDELGLTAQQKSDIQIIIADYLPRFRDLAGLGQDAARELMETAPNDPAYVELTQNASALAASSAAEMVTLLAEMRGKLYSVLTTEQHEKIKSKLAEVRAQHEAKKAAEKAAE
jgi:Spy/CpxP family protein refolding chaperone